MIKHKYGKADLTSATRFQVRYLGSGDDGSARLGWDRESGTENTRASESR